MNLDDINLDDINLDQDDQIVLEDLAFYGYHGVTPEEGKIGCRFSLMVRCGVDLSAAARTDHVDDTISYADIFEVVETSFSKQRQNLLETVAQRIVDDLFAQFPAIGWVQLGISKPEAPIPVVTGIFGIQITRKRADG